MMACGPLTRKQKKAYARPSVPRGRAKRLGQWWEPRKRRQKNAAASALAKLRWSRASEPAEIPAGIAKMIEARKRLKKSFP
jgi:hypothetical protein